MAQEYIMDSFLPYSLLLLNSILKVWSSRRSGGKKFLERQYNPPWSLDRCSTGIELWDLFVTIILARGWRKCPYFSLFFLYSRNIPPIHPLAKTSSPESVCTAMVVCFVPLVVVVAALVFFCSSLSYQSIFSNSLQNCQQVMTRYIARYGQFFKHWSLRNFPIKCVFSKKQSNEYHYPLCDDRVIFLKLLYTCHFG